MPGTPPTGALRLCACWYTRALQCPLHALLALPAPSQVRALFAVAAHVAPSVIFIDEVDSLLSARKSDGMLHLQLACWRGGLWPQAVSACGDRWPPSHVIPHLNPRAAGEHESMRRLKTEILVQARWGAG